MTTANGRSDAYHRASDLVYNALRTGDHTRLPRWVLNQISSLPPSRWMGSARLDPPNRDLDKDCGYPPDEPQIEMYRQLYDRVGIAARVVNIWPDESWAAFPELYETEKDRQTAFERRWNALAESMFPWHFLHRIDRLSGVGQYGVLLMGIDDGRSLAEPADGLKPDGTPTARRRDRELIYLRPFDQTLVQVDTWETDTSSRRFRQPVQYILRIADSGDNSFVNGAPARQEKVHWTRILHVADNRECNEVEAVPRLRPVLNNILDIRKLAGASAEMFWKGGFPGYQFKTNPDLGGQVIPNEDDVRDEIEGYQNGLQRYLTAVGGEWESLAPQVADPEKHFDLQIRLLCATIQTPVRIFLGSEAGHLAGTEDALAWKSRLEWRRRVYVEPMLIRTFVSRLQHLGVLPTVKSFIVRWPDLTTLSDKDRADVALKQVQALMQYIAGNVNQVMPQRILYTQILGFSEAMADAIEQSLRDDPPPPPILPATAAKPFGGGRSGNPTTAPVGRPAGTAPEGKARPARTRPQK